MITKYPPEYIGDSVYMEFDGDAFVIWTDNGYGKENVIYLESSTIGSFESYVDRVREHIKNLRG